jgi:predicted molibdopterin-dependent oxidoreductase YjgC
MSNSMKDVANQAAAMLIIGSNTTEQHPVFGTMIRQAVLRRGVKVAHPPKTGHRYRPHQWVDVHHPEDGLGG